MSFSLPGFYLAYNSVRAVDWHSALASRLAERESSCDTCDSILAGDYKSNDSRATYWRRCYGRRDRSGYGMRNSTAATVDRQARKEPFSDSIKDQTDWSQYRPVFSGGRTRVIEPNISVWTGRRKEDRTKMSTPIGHVVNDVRLLCCWWTPSYSLAVNIYASPRDLQP